MVVCREAAAEGSQAPARGCGAHGAALPVGVTPGLCRTPLSGHSESPRPLRVCFCLLRSYLMHESLFSVYVKFVELLKIFS